ncbi:hypothetical protein EYF80_043684 [Liparis tanakae]|uniref:Uncharacterized protein n=1 Tax=Liparis tanakae TaxID=230148 RepID=A0A4Z2FXX6_9TELE|nr:hypothetical protein EYF80_043684 [Liparis tanakae]
MRSVWFLRLKALIIEVWGKDSTSHQQLLVNTSTGELRRFGEKKGQQAETQPNPRGGGEKTESPTEFNVDDAKQRTEGSAWLTARGGTPVIFQAFAAKQHGKHETDMESTV